MASEKAMNCPSCANVNPDGAAYCGRCRLHFSPVNLFFTRLRDHLYWIFRRAGGGFVSGVVAWFFIPALSRVLADQAGAFMHFTVTGLLGGAFLGTVDGMVEESNTKTIKGGLIGGLGGALGGLTFAYLNTILPGEQLLWGFSIFWGIAGGFIGVISAVWERKFKKLAAGILCGVIGGAVGGYLGYGMYANIVQEWAPQKWIMVRLCEGFSGGIVGVCLWFAIGMAERFVIFQRRRIEGKNHKHCDHCNMQNPLNTWYCVRCGSVLQESAPPASLNLSPYTTLDRLKELFRFLSRLSATTGVIAGLVVFGVFSPTNPILALVAFLLVGLLSYLLLVLFSSISETIQIAIKK